MKKVSLRFETILRLKEFLEVVAITRYQIDFKRGFPFLHLKQQSHGNKISKALFRKEDISRELRQRHSPQDTPYFLLRTKDSYCHPSFYFLTSQEK